MSIQPLAVSMPVMCMPWQVAQVRLTGLPRPTVFRCIESLIQNVRNMNTSWPRAMDSRAALRAFAVSSARPRQRASTSRPSERHSAWCCCRARRRRPPRDCAARTPAGRRARPGCRRRGRATCADVDLPLEFDDARELRGAERRRHLQVVRRGILRLHGQRRRARVGHQVHARRLARLRIARRRHAVLADERADAEVLVRRVLRVGHGTRTPVHRDRRASRCSARSADRVLQPRRIAHDFDRELRIDAACRRRRCGGHGSATRNRPRSSSSECERGSPGGRFGQFMPSTAANSGSLPPVAVPALADAVAPTATCRRTAGGT